MSPGGPAVSVVIATYNWSAALRCAIRSVLLQTVQDFEVVVVGDGCTDDSAEVVAAFADPRLRWHNLDRAHGSQWAANNHGIRQARGDWIAYLGHDDVWYPTHLEALLRTAQRTGADLVASVAICYGPPGSGIHAVTGVFAGGVHGPRDFMPPSSIGHARSLVERTGYWRNPATTGLPVDCALLVDAVAGGARVASTGELTAFKFNAAWRRDAYRTKVTAEQEAMLARIERGIDFRHEELLRVIQSVVDDKLHRFVIPERVEDAPGALAARNRRIKGVAPRFAPGELRPVAAPTRFALTDQDGPFEWHLEERDERFGAFRWTGPLTTSTIELPVVVDRPLEVGLHLLHVATPDLLRTLRLTVNGQPVPVRLAGTEAGTVMLHASIAPGGGGAARDHLRLALHLERTARPCDLGPSPDRRWLGVAVNWVEVAPRAPGSRPEGLDPSAPARRDA